MAGKPRSGQREHVVWERRYSRDGYTFTSRFGEGEGTNPEELTAAAHAGCFSMQLANVLSQAGHEPESVTSSAKVHLDKDDGGFSITRSNLTSEVKVDGLSDDEFQGMPTRRSAPARSPGRWARLRSVWRRRWPSRRLSGVERVGSQAAEVIRKPDHEEHQDQQEAHGAGALDHAEGDAAPAHLLDQAPEDVAAVER